MTAHDTPSELQWTPWTLLDGLGPLLAIGTGQSYDELAGSLEHLQDLGLMQFGSDGDGRLWFRGGMDQATRRAALPDDLAQTHCATVSSGAAWTDARP
jgi:hypothetical protein